MPSNPHFSNFANFKVLDQSKENFMFIFSLSPPLFCPSFFVYLFFKALILLIRKRLL